MTARAQEMPMVKVSNKAIDRQIRMMVSRIVKEFDPERIILFGSRARKMARRDSDVDLLVVMNVKRSKRHARLAIRELLHDIPVPTDIVVTSPAEFEWRKDIVGTIEYPAVHEGRSLYEKT